MTRRLLLVTDAWRPQVNGVVRTLEMVASELPALGVALEVLHPGLFRSVPMPGYSEIRMAVPRPGQVRAAIEATAPDAVHVATEGPLGWSARRACGRLGIPFTTAYHTRFPEYLAARTGIPVSFGYAVLRRFHRPSRGLLVATASIRGDLAGRGFGRLVPWSRGVDLELFHPSRRAPTGLEPPVLLSVGRLAVEKNVEAFLAAPLPGTKVVVGDGPARADLERRFGDRARFVGARGGEELARWFASADGFVFPSRTDTFGLVLLEALASGTPVAAFPVSGPLDVVGCAPVGALDEDLVRAVERALAIDRRGCRAYAEQFTWRATAEQLVAALAWR